MRRRITRSGRRRSTVWQVIYMDLMTIMMVYFVILWTAETSASNDEVAGISDTIGNQTARMISIPGDVLFPSGKSTLSSEGLEVLDKLFGTDTDVVLDFEQGGLVERRLVIHGHTDALGDKDENFALGYERAREVYEKIRSYSAEVPDHVVLCTHADNTPAEALPSIEPPMTDEDKRRVRTTRAKNRRISIEDQVFDRSR